MTRSSATRLVSFVKAYEVRGVVGEQLTPAVACALGWAFARFVLDENRGRSGMSSSAVVIAHDMRESSPVLSSAFAGGVTAAGLDAVLVGLASTDMLYFASGMLDLPGAMFTASHNPETTGELTYSAPVPEFRLSRLDLDGEQRNNRPPRAAGAAEPLGGRSPPPTPRAYASPSGREGQSIWVPAAARDVRLTGTGVVFRATDGLAA